MHSSVGCGIVGSEAKGHYVQSAVQRVSRVDFVDITVRRLFEAFG